MSFVDTMRTIVAVSETADKKLAIIWSDDTSAILDIPGLNPADAAIGEWGQSLIWPSGAERSAETLWLATLTATGHEDARQFLEWRLRHGLSLTKSAEALGISRRMAAYYSNGEKPVPKPILLACRGWEANQAA